MPEEVALKYEIVYYPFMGTNIITERLLLMARLCYRPIGATDMKQLVWGEGPEGQRLDDEQVGRFIRGLIKSGHLGALEHWHTSFAVEGYSRVSSQQNDRHRLMKMFKSPDTLPGDEGCRWINGPEQGSPDVSQLQQSQRYVKEGNFRYITPPSFKSHPEFLERFRRLQQEIQDLQRHGLNEAGLPAEDVRFGLSNATETRFVITTNARQLRHMFNLRCCTRAQWEIRNLFNALLEEYKRIAPNIFWRAGASCDDLGYCPEGSASCGRAPTIEELRQRAGLD